ncbi:MAG: HAD-IC family P-type ATPase, partial [Bacteroidota bacterium]
AGLVFFLLIGRWFQTLTFARLNFDRDYRDYFPIAAYREDAEGTPEPVASEDLAVGDILLVRPGHLIPADGTLLTDTAAGIDYSFVTGEAAPRPAAAGQEVFAGGRATASALRIAVTKPADQSYLLQLWLRESGGKQDAEVAPPERLIRAFTGFILLLGAATLAYWYNKDVTVAYRAATAVLIIACPCALALAAPFAYGTLQRLLAKAGFYFRGPAVLQRLGSVDTFVFDKTGTLTVGGHSEELSFKGEPSPTTNAILLAMARQSDHPRSQALANGLLAVGGARPSVKVGMVEEVVGAGITWVYNHKTYRIGKAEFCGLPAAWDGTWASVNGQAYLHLGHQEVQLRPGAANMLRAIRQRGKAWLLSGDHPPATNFWAEYLKPENIAFEQSPFDKRQRINQLQETGAKVLMVGDGLNDAGALGAATVGLAINEDEAHFNPACDGIVKADQIALLPQIMATSANMKWVLWLTYGLAFAYNVIGLSYAVTGTLSPVVAAILMPLSSVTIVVVAVLGALLVNRRISR